MQIFKNLNFRLSLKNQERVFGLWLLFPALFIIVGVLIYPLLQGVIYSFRDYNYMSGNRGWVFLDNYIKLFNDEIFFHSIKNTFVFTSSATVGGFIIGLILALILNQKIFFRSFFRAVFLIPWIITPVITAMMFSYMFNSEVGIVNYVLKQLHIINDSIAWLGTPTTAVIVVIITTIWMQFPFHTVMYLAALQAIPQEINEASLMDGAGTIKRFFYITLPFLKNVILINITLITIWNINVFDIIWTMTYGGPSQATTTSAIYLYMTAFKAFDVGYASAMGMFWVIILMIFAFIYIKLIERNQVEI